MYVCKNVKRSPWNAAETLPWKLCLYYQARRAQRDSDDSDEEVEEDEDEEDIEALLDAEEEDDEEVEEEEEESEEDAIERLKTEIGDRYDEETGRVATVQVSVDHSSSSVCTAFKALNSHSQTLGLFQPLK